MPLPDDLQLRYVETIDDAMDMKRWLSEDRGRSCIGVDTETSGLTWNRPGDRLRLVQVGDKHTGWSVPWELWGGAFMEVLNTWDGQIALHNASYDLKFLERYANWTPPWSRLHDTMIMARIMRPGRPAGLKPLAKQLIDPRGAVLQQKLDDVMKQNKWDWNTVPLELPEYHLYGALDPVETAYLYDIFRADLAYPEVYDLEMATLRICYNMEKSGFRVDLDYAHKKREELEQFVHTSREWGKENLGLSIGSPSQLIHFFQGVDRELTAAHEKHAVVEVAEGVFEYPECDVLCDGVKITERTPGGQPSMNADQLKLFLTHPEPRVKKVAKLAYDARKAEKLSSTYFKAILEKNVDGFIHPSINTMGAVTARMSCSEPNLQNLPSNSSVVKNAFIARDGQKLFTSDLDQVEFRIFSCYSEDEGLLDAFRTADATGNDAFTVLGQQLYNDPSMVKGDPRRSLVKTYIYAKLFGASIKKQAASAGVTVQKMEEFAEMVNTAYPRMEPFQQSVIDGIVRKHRQEGEGYVITPTTNRRLPVDPQAAYRGVNYLVQSSAADIMKGNLVKLDAAGLSDYLRVPVHDEIVLDVPVEDLEDARAVTRDCMTTTEGWAIPLTGDISGNYDSWGAKYEKEG